MKTLLNIFAILFLANILQAQENENFPALSKGDSEEIEVLETKQFDGESLWGHINGGADLYLEYGFDELLYQKVYYKGVIYRVEYYKMVDPEAAFGIFSVRRFNCTLSDTLTSHICITGNLIQAALGSIYLSISNELETPEALEMSYDLFSIVLGKVNETSYELPDVLKTENIETESVKLIKGTLGFQNGYPMWEMMFEEYNNYKVIIVPIENDSLSTTLSFVQFESTDDRERFLSNYGFSSTVDEIQRKEEGSEYIYSLPMDIKNLLFIESDDDSLNVPNYIN